jgi:hypothetical protein
MHRFAETSALRTIAVAALAFGGLAAFESNASAATITVCLDGTCDFTSRAAAVAARFGAARAITSGSSSMVGTNAIMRSRPTVRTGSSMGTLRFRQGGIRTIDAGWVHQVAFQSRTIRRRTIDSTVSRESPAILASSRAAAMPTSIRLRSSAFGPEARSTVAITTVPRPRTEASSPASVSSR